VIAAVGRLEEIERQLPNDVEIVDALAGWFEGFH
jgi:hypothetical protein